MECVCRGAIFGETIRRGGESESAEQSEEVRIVETSAGLQIQRGGTESEEQSGERVIINLKCIYYENNDIKSILRADEHGKFWTKIDDESNSN
jgi:hypothetical protein